MSEELNFWKEALRFLWKIIRPDLSGTQCRKILRESPLNYYTWVYVYGFDAPEYTNMAELYKAVFNSVLKHLEYVEKRDIDHDSIIKLMEGQILEGLGNDEPTQNSIFGAMMKVHMNHESAHSDAFDIDQNEKANPVTTDHHESAHSVATDRCPSCGYTETPEGELCQLCEFDKKNP